MLLFYVVLLFGLALSKDVVVECQSELKRLLDTKRVCETGTTYFYSYHCAVIPRDRLIALLNASSSLLSLEEVGGLTMRMVDTHHGPRYTLLSWSCRLARDNNLSPMCYVYYDTFINQFRDGLVVPVIKTGDLFEFLFNNTVCPSQVTLIKYN